MSEQYVIDTVATITAVHQAFQIASTMPEGPEREGLILSGNSALSVVSNYLRHPRVITSKKHYDSVGELLATLQSLAGPKAA